VIILPPCDSILASASVLDFTPPPAHIRKFKKRQIFEPTERKACGFLRSFLLDDL
jgi:hypothetical protein